jgi:hypothetical protein
MVELVEMEPGVLVVGEVVVGEVTGARVGKL